MKIGRQVVAAGVLAVVMGAGAVRVEDVNGTLRFFRDGAAEPYAEMARPAEAEFAVTAEPGAAFAVLEVWPKTPAAETTVGSLALPPIVFAPSCVAPTAKALGTAGLTAPNGHSGSYMFLALAEPFVRRGAVVAWLTSRHGSGIVFSGVREGRVDVRPELQYGRLPLAAGASARDRGEKLVVGAFDDCRLGLEAYADAVVREFDIKLNPQLAGYCTWYANKHSGAGDEASSRAFAAAAEAKLKDWGFDFFQIDDKWQLGNSRNGPAKNFTAANPKGPYPNGMKPTADDFKSKGFRAGLWFMPFSGNYDDPYYADKQDWFVKSAIDYPPAGQKNTRRFNSINQKKGAPYETFWGGTCLDLSHPTVLQYVHDEVVRIAKDWGYTYFKYDGTWTAMACEQLYINDGYLADDLGQQIFHDRSLTNVEVFRKGLGCVRDAAGKDVFIMSCNVSQNMRTMGGAYGLVDAIRIGPDNGANWGGICRGPIRGTARYFYNGRVWYNDPDPVYVRDAIPLAHARTICSWAALSGQLFAFSDWLPELSDERVDVLRRTMAPHRLYGAARPVDLFESSLAHTWSLGNGPVKVFGFFNWNANKPLAVDYPAAYAGLDPAVTYAGWDFWANAPVAPFKGALQAQVPPTDGRVVAVVPFDRPRLVSASRHVCAPLAVVTEADWSNGTLSGTAATTVGEAAELRFTLPDGYTLASVDIPGAKIQSEGAFARVSFTAATTGSISWKAVFRK